MNNDVILNNIEHQHLRVINKLTPEFGDNNMCVALLLSELRNAQGDFPIVFHKDESTDTIYPMALFGFHQEENLFISDKGWDNNVFLPALLQKGPFKIGHQQTPQGDENLLISIDLNDPKVSESEGEMLFLPHGGNSEYIQYVASVLSKINSEREPTADFTQKIDDLGLLEPLNVEFNVSKEHGIRLTGFYSINEEVLSQLDADTLFTLNQNGYLPSIYMCLASLSNLSKLIRLKQSQ